MVAVSGSPSTSLGELYRVPQLQGGRILWRLTVRKLFPKKLKIGRSVPVCSEVLLDGVRSD